MNVSRKTVQAITLLGCSYFALWACAPTMADPALVPLADGQHHEVSLTGSGSLVGGTEFFDGQINYRHVFGPGVQLSLAAGLGSLQAIHTGAGIQVPILRTDVVQLGVSGELGALYGSLGVPLSIRLSHERAYFWFHPSGGLRQTAMVRLPVGFTTYLGETFTLGAQGGALIYSIQDPLNGELVPGPFGYAALQVGARW